MGLLYGLVPLTWAPGWVGVGGQSGYQASHSRYFHVYPTRLTFNICLDHETLVISAQDMLVDH